MENLSQLILESSSDEEASFGNIRKDANGCSVGDKKKDGDSDDDVLVKEVISDPPKKSSLQSPIPTAVEIIDINSEGEGDDDDCIVLDGDPEKPVLLLGNGKDSDDVEIVGEKGEVACRDFPHSRHLCAKFVFASTLHQNHCSQCHCYVCDSVAPCLNWGTGTSSTDHCHASDKQEYWRTERKRNKKGVIRPCSVSSNVIVPSVVVNPSTNNVAQGRIVPRSSSAIAPGVVNPSTQGHIIPTSSNVNSAPSVVNPSTGIAQRHIIPRSSNVTAPSVVNPSTGIAQGHNIPRCKRKSPPLHVNILVQNCSIAKTSQPFLSPPAASLTNRRGYENGYCQSQSSREPFLKRCRTMPTSLSNVSHVSNQQNNSSAPPIRSQLRPHLNRATTAPQMPAQPFLSGAPTMQCVGSAGNSNNSVRNHKEKRLTYVLKDADVTKHCAGINGLAVLKSRGPDECDYLFTGSRDGTLKRWALSEDGSTSSTFESHVDWVNDAVITGGNTLVSCSSDATVKAWNCFSNGTCARTFRQHSDYVTCLAAAEKNSNVVASGGLGGEVFIWDIEAALAPISKSNDMAEGDCSTSANGPVGPPMPNTSLRPIGSSNNISLHAVQSQRYVPVAAKGHKGSVYALATNDRGTLLVSGGTEKVVCVWDPRSGSKTMKLRGHTDNIRALLLDSTGRYCLSGSSDSMIRLWDLAQQRCVHSYAVHSDSVWALASTPTFSHVYSGGRDLSLYLTDLATRESVLLCTNEHPVLQLALHDDGIWVATTDSSVHKWPAETNNPIKLFQRGGSFLAGNLSFSRTRVSLEGSTPDTAGTVKLWEITRGVVIENFGEVSFEKKREELFEMVSVPAWFTVDTRLGSLSVHLDTPQCFSAEIYSVDLSISGTPEDDKVNLARETLKGLLAHWLTKRRQRFGSSEAFSANGEIPSGKDTSTRTLTLPRIEGDCNSENDSSVYPLFEFSTASPPSIVTEGSQGGPWRKKITELGGTEDEKDLPWWVVDCVLNNRLPPRENTKCSFYLHPCEGSSVQILTQGKISAPPILRINKVVSYVVEKLVLGKPIDSLNSDGTFTTGIGQIPLQVGDVSLRSGLKPWQKLKPSVEILCNNQVLAPDMSLATVRAYIWKKPEDLILNYRLQQGR